MAGCGAVGVTELVVRLDVEVEAVAASDDARALRALELDVYHQPAHTEGHVDAVLVDVPVADGVAALGSEYVDVGPTHLLLLPTCCLSSHWSPSLAWT